MARNLCRSLTERGRLDTDDVRRRHLDWLASDPPDVGNLTRRVLGGIRDGVPDAAERYVSERGPEVSAGNGSVMYCAPLGAFRAARAELLVEEAPALSAITHWDERCRTACLTVTLAVAALVRGEAHRKAVQRAVGIVLDREGGEELEYLVAEAGRARSLDGPDMGFTLFTAGIGLQVAARECPSRRLAVRRVLGATPTRRGVTGWLARALHGRAALPSAWRRSWSSAGDRAEPRRWLVRDG